jgi:hypothetical protein
MGTEALPPRRRERADPWMPGCEAEPVVLAHRGLELPGAGQAGRSSVR